MTDDWPLSSHSVVHAPLIRVFLCLFFGEKYIAIVELLHFYKNETGGSPSLEPQATVKVAKQS